MYNTAFARIKCVIDGYLSSTASHIHNLVLVVNEELHLISIEKSVRAYSNLNFLLNLSGDPSKAYRIIKKLESMLAKINAAGLNNENEEFYFRLMHDAVVHNFKKDPSALLYLKQLISNISIVIKDDSQFSDFNYF